jgi:O-antigen/teichoic acid export membrane protein
MVNVGQYRLFKNTALLLLSRGFYIGIMFMIYVILVRGMQRHEINTYSLAIIFYNLFILVVDFGITDVIIRRSAAEDGKSIYALFSSGILAKSYYAVVGYIILFLIVTAIYSSLSTRQAILILCLGATIGSFSDFFDGLMVGIGRVEVVAVCTFCQYGILLAGSYYAAIIKNMGLFPILWIHVCVVCVFCLLRILWISRFRKFNREAPKQPQLIRSMRHESIAFGISSVIVYISGTHLYVFIISLMTNVRDELAVFQGGIRIVGLAFVLGTIVSKSLFAAASNALKLKNRADFLSHISRSEHLLALVFIGGVFLLATLHNEIVNLLYGQKLAGANKVLLLAAISMPISFYGFICDAVLGAAQKQSKRMKANLIWGIIAVPLTFFMTKWFGIGGTTVAWVIVSAGQTIVLVIVQYKYVGYRISTISLWKIVLSGIFMSLFAYYGKNCMNVIYVIIGAVSIYIGMLIVFREDKEIIPNIGSKIDIYFKKYRKQKPYYEQ